MKLQWLLLVLTLFIGCIGGPEESPSPGAIVETNPATPTPAPTAVPPAPEPTVELIDTVTVTPDENFPEPGYGGFCRFGHVTSTDTFMVTFNNGNLQGTYFKEYTTGMEETGRHGTVHWPSTDIATVMVDDKFYLLNGHPDGWELFRFDGATTEEEKSVVIKRDREHEIGNDQMLAYVNGMLDASSIYDPYIDPNPVKVKLQYTPFDEDGTIDEGTHHRFYTLDLEPVGGLHILDDTQNINGMSALYVDGIYYFITSNKFLGDLIVMKYDEDLKYLGAKKLAEYGQWSQGSVYDKERERFYVAYIQNQFGTNIQLAIFDFEWNLIENIKVTQPGADASVGRPSVFMHDEKLYVSYDRETFDTETLKSARDWWCEVSVYEIL